MSIHTFVCLLAFTVATNAMSFNLRNIALFRRQAAADTFVSFSAGLTHDASLTNSSVVFDKILINTGNGYDNNTGVFTCPHAGVYVFIYNGLSQNAGQMWLDLYKNNQYQITGYAHNAADYASASNALLLHLNQGDTVYVKGRGTNTLYGRSDDIYATFSGFILIPNQGSGHAPGGK